MDALASNGPGTPLEHYVLTCNVGDPARARQCDVRERDPSFALGYERGMRGVSFECALYIYECSEMSALDRPCVKMNRMHAMQ